MTPSSNTFCLKGENEHTFQLYQFNNFDELKSKFGNKPNHGLYVFLKRNSQNEFDLLYFDRTDNLATEFNNHKRKIDIVQHGATHIAVYEDNDLFSLGLAENDIKENNTFLLK